jgi:adenylate cyclase
MLLGRYEQAMSHLEQAMRISPRDSNLGLWHAEMGRDLLALRRPEAAVQEGLKAVDLGYGTFYTYANLAAFYAAADKIPEAKAALAEAMKMNRKLCVAYFRAHTANFIDGPPGMLEALIKAGLPEE